ncbi:1445_t:CDS:2 [Entrophospora sp. SA101]|nr:1439_t:CDS:2 [Entrophospora sp. SA101]CAJ0629789.1 1445_t:CDS:2 [Entrophospora sp. SA101]CAJ0826197.1 6396_t:CDS:2 [Entrophospora sp. SA101]CAJ0854571.1 3455_t:CDS:2 [Entrophospora sp. SA101]CAJ0863487.1 14017_t:CDS:2 [Entrophospora sp. SA101]
MGCDPFNCFITKTITTEETGCVLPCGHAYHNTCFNQDGSLHQINLNGNAEGEDPDSILEGDNDDIKESADDILAP